VAQSERHLPLLHRRQAEVDPGLSPRKSGTAPLEGAVAAYDARYVPVLACQLRGRVLGAKRPEPQRVSATMDLRNRWGRRVEVEGCFMPKGSLEPGLDVADLIAHTAGRQRRHELAGRGGHTKDFQQTYWHSPIPPEFVAITSIEVAEAVKNGQAVPRRQVS
jgi:hypothetical protein